MLPRCDGDRVIDAQGALIAPGLVDLGVFAIDQPAFHFGGITRAALMPDQSPLLDHPARVQFAAQSGKPDLWVHPLAAATRGLGGTDLAELALMRDAGARAVGHRAALDRRFGRDAAGCCAMRAMLGLVVIAHAEDGGLTGAAVATAGETATRLGLPAAPADAEALAVARDIALAEDGRRAAAFPPGDDRRRRSIWSARPSARGVRGDVRASRRRISCCRTWR